MSDQPIRKLVDIFAAAGATADREDLRLYLGRLLDATVECRRSAHRGIGQIVALAALFILLSTGGLTEAEIFGVKLQKFTFFLLVIPTVTSIVFARTANTFSSSVVYEKVYYLITKKCFAAWHESDMDTLLVAVPGQLARSMQPSFYKPGLGRRVQFVQQSIEVTLFVVAPLAFVVYAYSWLLNAPGVPTFAAVISASVSAGFLVLGWLQLISVDPYE